MKTQHSKLFTRKRVVRNFFARKRDAAGSFHTVDGTLYSYNLPLAKLDDSGRAVALPGLEEKHSRTTSNHQTYARMAVTTPGYF